MSKAPQIVLGVLCFILLVIVIVLAALYGTEHNCKSDAVKEANKAIEELKEKLKEAVKEPEKETTKAPEKELAGGPSMVHFPAIRSITEGATLLGTGNATSYMKTIAYSPVPGKEMQGGVLHLQSGASLNYDQWFEGFVFVLEGSFSISDNTVNSSAQTGLPGDSFYIPRGAKIQFQATPDSRLYYVMQPPGAESAQQFQKAGKARPKIEKKINHKVMNFTLFVNKYDSLSYLDDIIFSQIKGRELTGGYYELLDGPALHYTYDYEEFKYIVAGEFRLKDGTGKEVVAKGGDLMYFPIGTAVEFTSPNRALGFYVGQRKGGEAK